MFDELLSLALSNLDAGTLRQFRVALVTTGALSGLAALFAGIYAMVGWARRTWERQRKQRPTPGDKKLLVLLPNEGRAHYRKGEYHNTRARPRKRARPALLAGRVLGVSGEGLFVPVFFALGLMQLSAFVRGLETWLGLGMVASIPAFAALLLLGPATALPLSIVGFYGAWKGWGWAWWAAAPLCCPFLVFALVSVLSPGFTTLFRRNRRVRLG